MKAHMHLIFLLATVIATGFAIQVQAVTDSISISINEMIQKAVQLSSQRMAAESDMNAQHYKAKQAWAGLGPRVSAEYSDARFDKKLEKQINTPAFSMTMPLRDDKARTGGITVAQPILGLYPLIQYANFENTQYDMKQAILKITEREIAFGAAEAYRHAQQAVEMMLITEASIRAAENQNKDAETLFRVGKLTRGDVLKIEMAILDAKAQAAKAEAMKETAFSALCEMLGLSLPCALKLDLLNRDVTESVYPIPDLNTAITKALAKRIEITTANQGVDLAGFGKQLAYAKFTPQVNAFVKWERDFVTEEKDQKNTRTIGFQATWDLWDNGSRFFAVYEASEQYAKAEAMKNDQEKKIRLEVYQAIENLKAAQETLSLARGAAIQAEESYRIEQVRFKSGASTTTDLLLSEAAQTKARSGYISTLTELDIQNMRVQKAIGEDRPITVQPSKK